MQAVVVDRFGGPDVLTLRDIPVPEPGPGQVRVKVVGAGINPVDTYNRGDGSWAGLSTPCILGYDIAGTVDAVGIGVPADRLGDSVMAMTRFPRGGGGYAEFAVVDDELVATVDPAVDLVAAASVPLAAGTAAEVLRLLQPAGDSMLVLGASGGVGLFLLQLAAAEGIRTIGVGRERNHSVMTSFGAAGCVDYRSSGAIAEAARLAGGVFDSIADLVGGPLMRSSQPYLRQDGVIAAIATPELDLDQIIDANQVFLGVLIRDDGERVRRLASQLSSGRLRTHVTHVLRMSEVAEAHRLVDSGEAGGKVVLTPGR